MGEQEITRAGNPRKPEGEMGEKMLQRMNESHKDVTAWGMAFLQVEEDSSVLDIGCGGGAALHRLAEMTKGHLTGVDYASASVATSRKTNEEYINSGRMEILEGSVEALPFEEDSFDRILTVESFYFWPDHLENLKEVRRVLKEGGIFTIIADIYERDTLTEAERENIARYSLFNPTPAEFERLLLEAGFNQVEIHTTEEWICAEGRKSCK